LKGSLTRNGESSPISEGKVTKETFTFRAIAGDQEEVFSGKMASEDQIRIWLERQGPERGVTLARVKS